MAGVSLRQLVIRRARCRVRLLTHVASLEVIGLYDLEWIEEGIEGGSKYDVPAPLFWLLLSRRMLSRRELRTLVARRFLHMGRGFVSKSVEWGTYVLDAFPEHRWRIVVLMGRSTYNLLTDPLREHLPQSGVPGERPVSTDRVQKISLFRLGLYGSSASTFEFFSACGAYQQKTCFGVPRE